MKEKIDQYAQEIYDSILPFLSEDTTEKEKEAIKSRIRSQVRNVVIDTVQVMKDAVEG